jgi:hypothetical protein
MWKAEQTARSKVNERRRGLPTPLSLFAPVQFPDSGRILPRIRTLNTYRKQEVNRASPAAPTFLF